MITTQPKAIINTFLAYSKLISSSFTFSTTRGYAMHPCYMSPNYEQLTYSPHYVHHRIIAV